MDQQKTLRTPIALHAPFALIILHEFRLHACGTCARARVHTFASTDYYYYYYLYIKFVDSVVNFFRFSSSSTLPSSSSIAASTKFLHFARQCGVKKKGREENEDFCSTIETRQWQRDVVLREHESFYYWRNGDAHESC